MSETMLLARRKETGVRELEEVWEPTEVASILGAIIAPVVVEGDRLDIDSEKLEVNRVYEFEYLDVNMVLWKSPDSTIGIYQVVEE